MPLDGETSFLANTNTEPVRAYSRPQVLYQYKDQLLSRISGDSQAQALFKEYLINYGNFYDAMAESMWYSNKGRQSAGHRAWMNIINEVMEIGSNPLFRLKRIDVLSRSYDQDSSDTIQETKSQLGLAPSVNWDSFSYKILPMGSEYLTLADDDILQNLNQNDYGIIDEIQGKVRDTIKDFLRRDRRIDETEEDFGVKDYSILIEGYMAGFTSYEHKLDIQSKGDASLMRHVVAMTQSFIQGVIPGTIQPAKLAASHDAISMSELQASIRKIAEQQVWQAGKTMSNPHVRAGIKHNGQNSQFAQSGKWTQAQATSIQHKASITQQLAAGMKSMNTDYYKPSKDLKNYAAGGPNDLGDELMKETQHEVPNMTPLDQEILSQSLSVLLACIRVRFDATQMTRFELVAQEDIDYLSVLERLAQYCEPNSHKFFIESTRILQEAMANGHNKVKHSNYGADENVMRQAIEEATREAQQLAKSIAYIDADLQQGREKFTLMMRFIFMSLASFNRRELEVQERYKRRDVMLQSIENQINGTSANTY